MTFLPLQVVLYFNVFYSPLWVIASIIALEAKVSPSHDHSSLPRAPTKHLMRLGIYIYIYIFLLRLLHNSIFSLHFAYKVVDSVYH